MDGRRKKEKTNKHRPMSMRICVCIYDSHQVFHVTMKKYFATNALQFVEQCLVDLVLGCGMGCEDAQRIGASERGVSVCVIHEEPEAL